MGKKKVTLKDIAAVTGYSITTISHVINKTRHVDKATRDRILDVIREVQYEMPDIRDKSGKNDEKTIAVVIADIREDFFAEIVKAIETSCVENNYTMILCDSEDDEEKELSYLDMLAERQVDGLILFPINSLKPLGDGIPSDLPVVILDRKPEGKNIPFIGIHNFQSAFDATKNLAEHGAKRIGFIGYGDKIYTSRERARGFMTAMREIYPGQNADTLTIGYHNENSTDMIEAFITDRANPKDGIICATSNICFDTISAISELGLRIPEDIKVISYDDNKWFDYLKYPVSAIRQPTTEMGIVAVEELVARIGQTRTVLGKDIFLDYEIIDRL